VTGDLSFFYDQNALWNQNLRGNLRILLLNNGKGGIFSMLPGLEQSAARDALVAASHHTTAEGICRQNAVGYCMADDMEQIQQGIHWLLTEESERPLLFEVRNLNN
jgi:2-succinyl-5-enolpyruvyl-6-hydroxy-3-cyclohexene-1-carboxylate synthase